MLSAEAEAQHVFGQKSSCNEDTESNDAGDTSVKGHLIKGVSRFLARSKSEQVGSKCNGTGLCFTFCAGATACQIKIPQIFPR